MTPTKIEVGDIIRRYSSAYLGIYENTTFQEHLKVLKNLAICRTEALGGHIKKCDQCDHIEVYYHSCRDRHCPKCQAIPRAKWMEARAADLIAGIQYFHVVFTIPNLLSSVILQNKRCLYNILFRAVSETLQTIAKDKKHLGAEIGFTAVLHTWGQTLHHHPHIHCLIPGGGLSLDGNKWIHCRDNFFLPIRVLSSLFKKKFLAYLKNAVKNKELSFHGKLKNLRKGKNWTYFLTSLYRKNWVVYAKPPFGGAQQLLKYLARYTHRVAIANQRLISVEDGKVSFRWKDYRNQNKQRVMNLDATEFIRRFLTHVLPPRFMRIRHYGFLSNRNRKEKLLLCRQLLNNSEKPPISSPESAVIDIVSVIHEKDDLLCPVCKQGRLSVMQSINPYTEEKLNL
ncbi:IS91 family transposase, partial [bacterium]|nr:IS91 family transposase [bacterium]